MLEAGVLMHGWSSVTATLALPLWGGKPAWCAEYCCRTIGTWFVNLC